jgi:predicted ATP-dependent protease
MRGNQRDQVQTQKMRGLRRQRVHGQERGEILGLRVWLQGQKITFPQERFLKKASAARAEAFFVFRPAR